MEQQLNNKYGTSSTPRLKSVNISTQTQDILMHEMFEPVPPVNLGVIRLYQQGAVESDMIPDPTNPSTSAQCGDYMSWDDELVQIALKYKNYLVPNISLTFTYFSKAQPQIDTSIPKFYGSGENFCGGYSAPEGWQCMFCGRGSEATDEKKGFIVSETYVIGKFPVELYDK